MAMVNNDFGGGSTLLSYYVQSRKGSAAQRSQAATMYSTMAQDTVELSIASMPTRVLNFANNMASGTNSTNNTTNPNKTGSKAGVEVLIRDDYNLYQKKGLPGYTGNVGDLDFVLSKNTPKMTDEELEAAIQELAKKHAAGGEALGTDDKEFVKLGTDYISSVSPDRKKIIREGTATTGYVPSPPKQDLAKAYDEKGNHIASYTEGYGWRNVLTPEETARNEKMLEIYFAAYDEEVEALKAKESAPAEPEATETEKEKEEPSESTESAESTESEKEHNSVDTTA